MRRRIGLILLAVAAALAMVACFVLAALLSGNVAAV